MGVIELFDRTGRNLRVTHMSPQDWNNTRSAIMAGASLSFDLLIPRRQSIQFSPGAIVRATYAEEADDE